MGKNLLRASTESILTISMQLRLSKFEACLAVLQIVEKRNNITFSDMHSTTKLRRDQLKDSIDVLLKNLLIAKRTDSNNGVVYSPTERGTRVLSFFGLKMNLVHQ